MKAVTLYQSFIATKVAADAVIKKWKDCAVNISDRNDKQGLSVNQSFLTYRVVPLVLTQ